MILHEVYVLGLSRCYIVLTSSIRSVILEHGRGVTCLIRSLELWNRTGVHNFGSVVITLDP